MTGDLLKTRSVVEVPHEVMVLAEALSRKHGTVMVSHEKNGYHLNMASPFALEQDGLREMTKRHLSVNASKYLGLGTWSQASPDDRMRCAVCMKTGTPVTVQRLMRMPPLEQRGYPQEVEAKVNIFGTHHAFVPDGKGNMIPVPPGNCVPITMLEPSHPAVGYLKSREYDLELLWTQFRCSWCVKETPEDRDLGIWYRRMPGGFNKTPQGRIVFYGDIVGVQRFWQARILEFVEGKDKYYWHPYHNEWVLCEQANSFGKFDPIPAFTAKGQKEWNMAKYINVTGAGTRADWGLLGLDAAVRWNMRMGKKQRICVLVEGPLDAGRFGPPSIAMLGKSLSPGQAMLLISYFDRVLVLSDNDASGMESRKSVSKFLSGHVILDFIPVPEAYKDPGDMPPDVGFKFITPFLYGS